MADTVVALGFLLMLGAIVVGIVVLASPETLKLSSRWYSVPFLTTPVLWLAIFLILSVGGHPSSGGGWICLLLWMLLAYIFCHVAKHGWRGGPTLRDVFARGSARPDRTAKASAPSNVGKANAAWKLLSVEQRLEERYFAYRDKRIDLDTYRRAVERELNAAEERLEVLELKQDEMEPSEYQADLAEAYEAEEKCQWRLDWIENQRRKGDVEPDDAFPTQGKWARFEYAGHDGEVSKRTITMWEKRGIYIVGYDRSRNEERTFRQDRISEWVCG
ncbi:WYL domain-containing protein [Novosphingobium mangrovi (ex Hu et al. 2023)]|uniref:WYL domain-containing protein n=1 Tax=Novosphingobium mangrovi (ex Hu et al. 2023) TaxID=2930094 RepID=A0ABT0A8W1_9SPHN|nr:WYL domain-containing protein [Novosphingobium mangrovi (ex Hu et al. 2023)]MCJ1959630.1 WYL domain-containing protein [Novosphingobium mangrovi (ex Hu et al. 2023)]